MCGKLDLLEMHFFSIADSYRSVRKTRPEALSLMLEGNSRNSCHKIDQLTQQTCDGELPPGGTKMISLL